MSEQLDVLTKVARILTEINVAYMISGSMAITFYAVPRMTRDIDIVVELKAIDVNKLVDAFASEFYIDDDSVQTAIASSSIFNILHNETLTKVDLIVRKDSEYRQLEFERRKSISIGGTEISVVSAEDLILSKLVWSQDSQSEMQQSDVRLLVSSDVGDLDWEYLNHWAKKLNVSSQLEDARS